jgi:predicted metal-dependent enzyme (double-stranded beta helix superfamily)
MFYYNSIIMNHNIDVLDFCKLTKNNINYVKDLFKYYNIINYEKLINNININYCNSNKYNKTLLYSNDYLDIYLITWFNGAITPIHDHPEGGCVMKILQGQLQEHLFTNVDDKVLYLKSNILNKNDIDYKIGNEILHRIESKEFTISLHVYFPSNYKCNTYLDN